MFFRSLEALSIVVAVTGDDLVARFERHLHAHHDGFLADIEVAEAADQTHAVHLAGFFLETADGQHGLIGGQILVLAEIVHRTVGARRRSQIVVRIYLGDRH